VIFVTFLLQDSILIVVHCVLILGTTFPLRFRHLLRVNLWMDDLSSSGELTWLHDSLAVHTAFRIILQVSYLLFFHQFETSCLHVTSK